MIHSESEPELDFSFAINSVSNFDSVFESDSESNSSLALINLDIYIFFTQYLHSSKKACGWFFLSILITESIVMQAMQV